MRFKYQELFSEIGSKAKDLRKKTVMIIGAGSVGSVVAEMLHREGINIRIVDMGRVNADSIQNEALYLLEDDNKFKAKQVKKRLESIDDKNQVKTFHEELSEDNLFLLDSADLVIDCSNDFKTMKMVGNHIKKKNFLISCKHSGSKGFIFISDKKYYLKEVFDKIKLDEVKKDGFISPVSYLAGAIIVAHALKTLVGAKISDNFISFDVWKDQIRRINI